MCIRDRCSLIGGVLVLVVYAVYYFLALGSSRIAPPSENHSTLKRLIALAVHGALMVTGLLLCLHGKDPDIALLAYLPLMFLTLIVCCLLYTSRCV